MAHVEKSKSPIRERRVVEHVVVEERIPVGVSHYSMSAAGMDGGAMAGGRMESRTVTSGGMAGGASHSYVEKIGERSRSPLRHNKN